MTYYVIKVPSDKKTAYCVESPSPGTDEFKVGDYRIGEKIDYSVPHLKIKTDRDHDKNFSDAIPTQGLEFIISLRFLDLLKSMGIKNMQNFPITVIDCFSKKKFDYWVCNVTGTIPCLDLKKSEISFDKNGEIFILRRMALNLQAIDSFNSARENDDKLKIFRLKEYSRYLIADESVRGAVINAGIKGIEFKKPEESGDFL